MPTSVKLQAIIKALAKQGIESSVLADDSSPCVVSRFLSTGCYILDAVMGGGLPLGRIVEIYGNTSTGKSLVASQACAVCQENGGTAVYIDTETAVSLPIMEAVGVDINSLIYLAPDTVEEVFAAMETAIDTKDDEDMLIVWDSIAATSAVAEMAKDTGEVGYLTHARVISQGLRKLARQVSKTKVAMLFLNQAKENLGVMFGDSVATFGGKAVGFHSSVRVMLSVNSKLKKDKRVIGILAHAKVTKNKIAPPFREADLPIYFGHGVDEAETILRYLKHIGLAVYGGGAYTVRIGDKRIKVKQSDWETWLDKNYDAVCDIIDKEMKSLDLL